MARNANLCILALIALIGLAPAAQADVVLPPAIAADPGLKDLRRSMMAGSELGDVSLRRLADAGEGLAAARFAQRLEQRGDPALMDDAAHYYSIAIYRNRAFALPRLLSILGRPEVEFGPSRLRNIREVLERELLAGDPMASAGMADLLIRGVPFGTDIPRARELLLVAAEGGDAKAAIRLAMSHFQGAPGLPPDPEAARPALELALTSADPGVQAIALTLGQQLEGGGPKKVVTLTPANASPRPRPRPANFEGVTQ